MAAYYDFEVSLREAKPRIWRRFLIARTARFLDLHEAISAPDDVHEGRARRRLHRVESSVLEVEFLDGDRRLPLFRLRPAA